METAKLASLGFALAGLAHLALGALTLGVAFTDFWIGLPAIAAAVGFFLAAAGFAASEGRVRLVAAGLFMAAVAYVPMTLSAYADPGPYQSGFLLLGAGAVEMAWYAILTSLRGRLLERCRGGLRLGAVACFLGGAWWFLLNVAGDYLFLAVSMPLVAGFTLVVSGLRPQPLPEATAAKSKPVPPS